MVGEFAYESIGERKPMVQALEKATGNADYTCDIKLPGMLYAKLLRSPYALAKLKKVSIAKAQQIPGVLAIITGDDVRQDAFGSCIEDEFILAKEKVRFVGEAIAAVAAISEEVAEEAILAIDTEYEELEPVTDVEKAIEQGAPLVNAPKNNVALASQLKIGDITKGFAEADYVFEHTFRTSKVSHCCMEPRSCVAKYENNDKLTIWSPTQNVYKLRKQISHVLGIPQHKIRVIQPFVGGGFGSRVGEPLSMDFACILLSQKTGRPVTLKYSREEEFIDTRTRHPHVISIKTGVKKDGTIIARHVRSLIDNGACTSSAPGTAWWGAYMVSSLYNVPNVLHEWKIVYTNKEPGGSFRGFGNPQVAYAVESQMNIIAKELNLDQIEIRLKNAVQSGTVAPTGAIISSCGLQECLIEVAKRIGWEKSRIQNNLGKGYGVACALHASGGRVPYYISNDYEIANIRLNEDGTANLLVGCSDTGQGSNTVLSQIAAETLGIHFENVEVLSADTEVTPMSSGTWGSRLTTVAGNAVLLAAKEAREKLIKAAAEYLEVGIEDIIVELGKVIVRTSGKEVNVGDVVKASLNRPNAKPIDGSASYDGLGTTPNSVTGCGNIATTYSFSAHAAEVEVDRETGQVTVTKFVAAHDVGKAINPAALEGQVEGSIAQGIGYALTEELQFSEKGVIMNASFRDYKLLTACDIGQVDVVIVETNDPHGPFGAKGVGEIGLVAIAPAINNAIFDATGVCNFSLPITPEKLLTGLESRSEGGSDKDKGSKEKYERFDKTQYEGR